MARTTMRQVITIGPSMKVPPKRKGNINHKRSVEMFSNPSMKVPPKRKGNAADESHADAPHATLNESPSEKEGKSISSRTSNTPTPATLNESPSEKEGK